MLWLFMRWWSNGKLNSLLWSEMDGWFWTEILMLQKTTLWLVCTQISLNKSIVEFLMNGAAWIVQKLPQILRTKYYGIYQANSCKPFAKRSPRDQKYFFTDFRAILKIEYVDTRKFIHFHVHPLGVLAQHDVQKNKNESKTPNDCARDSLPGVIQESTHWVPVFSGVSKNLDCNKTGAHYRHATNPHHDVQCVPRSVGVSNRCSGNGGTIHSKYTRSYHNPAHNTLPTSNHIIYIVVKVYNCYDVTQTTY